MGREATRRGKMKRKVPCMEYLQILLETAPRDIGDGSLMIPRALARKILVEYQKVSRVIGLKNKKIEELKREREDVLRSK